jgi:preprotein translocase subunit Sec63
MRIQTPSERLTRAYATLELPPDASPREAVRQYKRLVKRWHPDRYATDPQRQAEASQRMREINAAFEVVRPIVSESIARPSEARFGMRLRPEEIDAIVQGIGDSSMAAMLFWCAVRSALLVGGSVLLLLGGAMLLARALAGATP